MQRETHKNCRPFFSETKRRLDSSIARTITFNIPLIPANTDLRRLLHEVTENQFVLRYLCYYKCHQLSYPKEQVCRAHNCAVCF